LDRVEIKKRLQKDLRKFPFPIIDKLEHWIKTIKKIGIMEARKISGFHDEPLQGIRKGQRWIRLNRRYRAIYQVKDDEEGQLIVIEEITHHEY